MLGGINQEFSGVKEDKYSREPLRKKGPASGLPRPER
jgi:hypothetical protein